MTPSPVQVSVLVPAKDEALNLAEFVRQCAVALGAAPFAVLFALFPTLSATAQAVVSGASALVFAVYALWVLRGPTNRP